MANWWNQCWHFSVALLAAIVGALLLNGRTVVGGQVTVDDLKHRTVKGQPFADLLSAGGYAAQFGPGANDAYEGPGWNNPQGGQHDNGRGGNTFVNDPCLDPPRSAAPFPANLLRTVQSETELAVLNTPGSMGKKIVAGYNDSYGFYNGTQGLSGYAYSIDGGNTWIDGGGLPPRNPAGPTEYFGDPVVVVHNPSATFYYSSIYFNQLGVQTLSVNRGRFVAASPTGIESVSNTRCLNHPEKYGVPDPPKVKERIQWDPPVEAVATANLCHTFPGPITVCDDLDKEWLFVSQKTGELYLTYTRFGFDGSTPLEMVRSKDGGATWEGPFVIVPNLADTFNQATQLVQTPSGRLLVVWHSRTFDISGPPFPETSQRIEYAYSDTDGSTWSAVHTVAAVNPQGEPLGYNRGRTSILNAPFITVDNGENDGVDTPAEMSRAGFGDIYVTYFNGKTALPAGSFLRAGDILLSTSVDNGATFGAPVKVNDDPGATSHVFPSVQADKQGQVFVGWLDRRNDALNLLTDAWANVSHNLGLSFGHDKLQSDVATSWFVRRDAAPNFGDYNSSELLGFNQFVMIWSDGRFPAQNPLDPTLPANQRQATPDVIFTIANGLGVGGPK